MGAPLLPPVFVNGTEIPAAAIAAEAQHHPAPAGKPGYAWRAAAEALVLRALCLQEARAEGLTPDPRETAPGLCETEEEALIRALLDRHVTPAAPEEAALKAAYAARPDRFRAPDLWEAAHILIAKAPDAAALARAICDELARAPARFSELAARHSACSSANSGGLLGQIGPGDTVREFEAALQQLTPGTITPGPVETRFGFHIIRLDAHAPGALLPYEAVRPRLEEAARKAEWAKAARLYAQGLMDRAEIRGLTGRAAG